MTLVAVVVGAGAVRFRLLSTIRPQVDEAASLLAIEQVSSKGIPLLPSNVFYSQGLVFSYLAAPLGWIFDTPDSLLTAARILNISVSLILVLVAFFMTQDMLNSSIAAFGVAVAFIFDPSLVEWSIWIRPYGLLTLLTLLIVWGAVRLLREGVYSQLGRVPIVFWIPLLSWLAVFTHVLVAILIPAIVVVACMILARYGFLCVRRLLVPVFVALLAPVALLLLNRHVGVGSGTGGASSVVGSHLVTGVLQNPNQTFVVWTWMFSGSNFDSVVPFVFLLAAGTCWDCVAVSFSLIGKNSCCYWRLPPCQYS